MEEIHIGAIKVENEKVVYSQVQKPSIRKSPKSDTDNSTPTFAIVDEKKDPKVSQSQERFPEPTSPPPPVPSRIGDTSPAHLDYKPSAEKILYTEISLPAAKKGEEKEGERKGENPSSPKQIAAPERVLYSDISKLSRSPSGRIVVCANDPNTSLTNETQPSANPLYADLNLIRSQTQSRKEGGAKDSSTTPPPNPEKVVYAEVDSIRKKFN